MRGLRSAIQFAMRSVARHDARVPAPPRRHHEGQVSIALPDGYPSTFHTTYGITEKEFRTVYGTPGYQRIGTSLASGDAVPSRPTRRKQSGLRCCIRMLPANCISDLSTRCTGGAL